MTTVKVATGYSELGIEDKVNKIITEMQKQPLTSYKVKDIKYSVVLDSGGTVMYSALIIFEK